MRRVTNAIPKTAKPKPQRSSTRERRTATRQMTRVRLLPEKNYPLAFVDIANLVLRALEDERSIANRLAREEKVRWQQFKWKESRPDCFKASKRTRGDKRRGCSLKKRPYPPGEQSLIIVPFRHVARFADGRRTIRHAYTATNHQRVRRLMLSYKLRRKRSYARRGS